MKRIKIILLFFILCSAVVLGKLFYISVIDGKNLARQAVAQRTERVKITSPRGIIYDRNMIKITDAEMELIVNDGNPYYIDKSAGDILSHVIGYISPDGNGSGIEGAFDYVLSSGDSSSIAYLKDINNNKTSDGYAIELDNSYRGVCLTIDYHIQKIAEKAMDNHEINGAVIVADCRSGEILAMASRPNFDRKKLADYLDGTDGELVNKAISQYNPGSVFKIIVAAAGLENAINDDRMYECTGKTNIDGIEFVCHKEDGHGEETMAKAFADSCNCAFYAIGNEIGTEQIYRYAYAFGIGNEVLRINGITEDEGFVPKESGRAENANISIGQGDVMVTPLQMADVLCTICNGGMRNQLTLIRGIVDSDGKCNQVDKSEIGRVVSETTARRLMNMMRLAVSDGTGMTANIDTFSAGGKTGSAETGWEKNGEVMQQGWFAGFFPADNPMYVCVVMAENGKSGTDSACPVFNEIGYNICKMNL